MLALTTSSAATSDAKRTPASRASAKARRRCARTAIVVFAVAVILLQAGVTVLLDDTAVGLRDPEYARRIAKLKAKLANTPGRPLVLVVGSSRTAEGISPGEWEINRPIRPAGDDPLIFNLSLFGGGPSLELLALQRAFADGVRPAVVVLENWPPLLCDGWEGAKGALSRERLGPRDHAWAAEYLPEALSHATDPNPIYSARQRLLLQLLPRWVPANRRTDWMWTDVDDWGWKPGCDFPPGKSEAREVLLKQARTTFQPVFAGYRIDPLADRAFREAVAQARRSGASVRILFMPESSEFRKLYPPAVESMVCQHMEGLSRELNLDLIDARCWMEDDWFSDGFHLTRKGAVTFTRRLGPIITSNGQ